MRNFPTKDGKVIITDLNSTNGSFINDVKIISSHLYVGDVLRIGAIEISLDGSRLKPSERKVLTRNTEVGTKFMDLKVNQRTHASYKADFTEDEDENNEFSTTVVDLEEQRQLIEKEKLCFKVRRKCLKRKRKKNKTNHLMF